MPLVHPKEPFIYKGPEGPEVCDPKEAYDTNSFVVKNFPHFFAGDKTLDDRGEGKTVTNIQVTPEGTRGRVKS